MTHFPAAAGGVWVVTAVATELAARLAAITIPIAGASTDQRIRIGRTLSLTRGGDRCPHSASGHADVASGCEASSPVSNSFYRTDRNGYACHICVAPRPVRRQLDVPLRPVRLKLPGCGVYREAAHG